MPSLLPLLRAPGRIRVDRPQMYPLAILYGVAMSILLLAPLGGARDPQESPPATVAQSASPAAGNPAAPGDTRSAAGRQPIRVRVDVVNVPVTVLDRRGMPVIDLKPDDFEVYEDGKLQTIRYFSREIQIPLRIGLLIDTSNSARRQLSFQKDAASEFVFTMLEGRKSRHQVFLQTYDSTSSVIQNFTNDPEILNDKIRALKAGGGKALYDAIYFACKEMMAKVGPPESVRRVLVIISDGGDVQSEHSLEEALSMARRTETLIYAIGNAAYGYSNPGDAILELLAQETGGAALFPLRQTPGTDLGTGYFSHGQIGDTSQNKGLGASTGIYSAQRLMQLADALETISRELKEQYNLGYTPPNPNLDGTYRSIRVVARRKDVELRHKLGYFAAAE